MNIGDSLLITISGLDGSGKTTQSNLLKEYLEGKNIKVIYLHKIKESLPNRLISAINKTEQKKLRGKEELTALNKKLRYLAFIFDLIYFKLTTHKLLRRKDIIISDRYFFDTIVNLQYLGVLDKSKNSYFYDKISPPNLGFFLDISPEEAFNREKEHTKDYYIEKDKLYKNFFKDSTAHVITGGSIAQIHDQIVEIVNSKLEMEAQ